MTLPLEAQLEGALDCLLLRKYKCICIEGEMAGIINFKNRKKSGYVLNCSSSSLKIRLCLLLKTGVKLLPPLLY